MCRNAGETISHLFIDCDFAKEIWNLILLRLQVHPPQHSSVANLYSSWFQSYAHNIPINSLWYHIWLSIPKFVCWEIWLAGNDLTFNNSPCNPTKSAAKAKALLLESVLPQSHKSDSSLPPLKRTG